MAVKFECSKQEAEEIKNLLAEIRRADASKQKSLRGKLRKIYGFYITEFCIGFTADDFEMAVKNGSIKVADI